MVGLGITGFYLFDIQQYFSLESLKTNRDRLDIIYKENRDTEKEDSNPNLMTPVNIPGGWLSLPAKLCLVSCKSGRFGMAAGFRNQNQQNLFFKFYVHLIS